VKKLRLGRKSSNRRESPQPAASNTFSYYRTSPPASPQAEASRNERLSTRRRLQGTRAGSGRFRRLLGKLPVLVAWLLIGASAFYMLSLSSNPRVILSSSEVDLALRDVGAYQADIQTILQKSVFSYSKLTINTTKISEQIKTEFPEFRDVSVVLPLLNRRPVVHIQPARPAFILMTRSGSFVLDTQGRAILEETRLASSARNELPRIQDDSQLDVQLTKQALSQNDVDFITTFTKELRSKDVQVQTITLPTVANEVHFGIKDQKYYVKANLQLDAKQQAGTFLAVTNKLQKDSVTPSQYIDVRVEERAYYL
jgi:hypothetical protein